MPLTSLSVSASIQTTMTKALNAFGNLSSPNSAVSFNVTGPNLSVWNQAFEQVYTLFAVAPSGLAATVGNGGSLTSGTTYYYKITAVGYASFSTTNETSGSNEASGTTSAGQQTINLSWTKLVGAVSYNVYRGTAAGAENVLIGNTTSLIFADNGTAATTSQSPPGAMPNNYVEFDLSSYTTLANETVTPGHVLGLFITTSGNIGTSQCSLTPGNTNGLTGLFTGTTPGLTLRINGLSIPFFGPASGDSGIAITGTSKTLRVTNAGTDATTVQIVAPTGP